MKHDLNDWNGLKIPWKKVKQMKGIKITEGNITFRLDYSVIDFTIDIDRKHGTIVLMKRKIGFKNKNYKLYSFRREYRD